MVRAGAGAGHSWVPTARQANQLQLQQTVAMAKQFEMRITFYVFAGVFHLVPAFSTFSTFPLCDFSVFFFECVCVFYSYCSCSLEEVSLSLSLPLDCLAKHVHCDFVHEIHVVLFTGWAPIVGHRSRQLTGVYAKRKCSNCIDY